MNTEPTTKTPDARPRIFKSLDPLWPRWGVSATGRNTQWFARKADADRHAKGIMKALPILLLLLLICHATSADLIPVRVDVICNDRAMSNRVVSIVSRELRKLGDVTLVRSNGLFSFSIAALHADNAAKVEIGWAFSQAQMFIDPNQSGGLVGHGLALRRSRDVEDLLIEWVADWDTAAFALWRDAKLRQQTMKLTPTP